MARLIYSAIMSLDGYIADSEVPDHALPGNRPHDRGPVVASIAFGGSLAGAVVPLLVTRPAPYCY